MLSLCFWRSIIFGHTGKQTFGTCWWALGNFLRFDHWLFCFAIRSTWGRENGVGCINNSWWFHAWSFYMSPQRKSTIFNPTLWQWDWGSTHSHVLKQWLHNFYFVRAYFPQHKYGIPPGTQQDVVDLLHVVTTSMSYKLYLRQERPPYVGIRQCKVNEGKTGQQKHINLN